MQHVSHTQDMDSQPYLMFRVHFTSDINPKLPSFSFSPRPALDGLIQALDNGGLVGVVDFPQTDTVLLATHGN